MTRQLSCQIGFRACFVYLGMLWDRQYRLNPNPNWPGICICLLVLTVSLSHEHLSYSNM